MTLTDTREVIVAPLPTWKDLTYAVLDEYFKECIYRELAHTDASGYSQGAIDLFVSNAIDMANKLGAVRAAVAAAP